MKMYFATLLVITTISCSSNVNHDNDLNEIENINDTIQVVTDEKEEDSESFTNSFKEEDNSFVFNDIKILSIKKVFDKNRYPELNDDCAKWIITKEDIVNVVSISEKMTGTDMEYLYNTLPCEYEGELIIDGKEYYYSINAGSYIILVDDKDNSTYLGCSNKKCEKFFIMEGGKIE